MKKVTFLYFIIALLTVTSIVLVFLIIQQKRQLTMMKHFQSGMIPGEQINYFDLIGTNNQRIDAIKLNDQKVNLIFILKQPCAPCNKNIHLWRKMAKILKQDANFYAIWLGNQSEMFEFQEKSDLGFIVFAPLDNEKLKQELKLNQNNAQTILYIDGKVLMSRISDLDGDSYTSIIRTVKKYWKVHSSPDRNVKTSMIDKHKIRLNKKEYEHSLKINYFPKQRMS